MIEKESEIWKTKEFGRLVKKRNRRGKRGETPSEKGKRENFRKKMVKFCVSQYVGAAGEKRRSIQEYVGEPLKRRKKQTG